MNILIRVMFACAIFIAEAQPAERNVTRDVMRFKLHFAQGVLEGITMENFSLVATNALKLKRLSESLDWKLRSTRDYERLTADFQRATDALERAARSRNVDSASVAYFQLTTTCVTCHKYLRGADVGFRPGRPGPPVAAYEPKMSKPLMR